MMKRAACGVAWLCLSLACGASAGGTSGAESDAQSADSGGQVTDPSGDAGGVSGACGADMRTGEATYYAADGSGNCSFDASPGDPLVAAINQIDYANSATCGACVEVQGPDAKIVVRVVDRCPGCPAGDIDLGEAAFAMIADKQLGRVPISWRFVSCPVTGDLSYRFKEGSSQWWTAIQVRNHRNPIASLEVRDPGGAWKPVERLEYNYFVEPAGMGPGPLTLRVTDALGNVIEDAGIPVLDGAEAPGGAQFPACEP